MNIDTVCANLAATISGKQQLLAEYQARLKANEAHAHTGGYHALQATTEFLKININELKRIHQDVTACCTR
jgi:hypothetical protein